MAMIKKGSGKLSRRNFLSSAGAGAFAFSIMKPELAFGTAANSKINLGIIGCGSRGAWIAGLFEKHGGFNVTAVADYFQDQVDAAGQKYNVPANRRFTTLSCYKKLLESKVDAVAIISPPYFHPEQARAAVDAGKHVYLAKPVAVDVPGCQGIEASNEIAIKKKLNFLVDFQTRSNEFYKGAVERIHSGKMGDITFGESYFHGGRLGNKAEPSTREARLRNWVFDIALSGDIIVEQNIHTLDVMSWVMNTTPLHVTGTCGRKVRTDIGDCKDYYALVYEYPNQVGITFSSKQFKGYDTSPNGIYNRMFGTKGVLEARYSGLVRIKGDRDCYYRGGEASNLYLNGPTKNIAAFHKNITEGNYKNDTVAESVRSNLVSILGRTAAYQGRRVTWNELIRSNEKLDGKLDGLKS